MLSPSAWGSVALLAVQDPQDRKEEVDNIQIQRDGRRDLLLHVIVPHDKLRIHKNVAAEDERRQPAIYHLPLATVREKCADEAKQDQDPQRPKQVWHPIREVILGLAGEQCQGEKDARGQNKREEYNPRIVKGGNDRDRVSLQGGKAGQKE